MRNYYNYNFIQLYIEYYKLYTHKASIIHAYSIPLILYRNIQKYIVIHVHVHV